MPLTTALIRAHLNLEPDDDRDEDLLALYADVAKDQVASYTGLPYDDAQPSMLKAALLLVAHQYENREPVAFGNPYMVPFGVHDLLASLKRRVTAYMPESGAS